MKLSAIHVTGAVVVVAGIVVLVYHYMKASQAHVTPESTDLSAPTNFHDLVDAYPNFQNYPSASVASPPVPATPANITYNIQVGSMVKPNQVLGQGAPADSSSHAVTGAAGSGCNCGQQEYSCDADQSAGTPSVVAKQKVPSHIYENEHANLMTLNSKMIVSPYRVQ